MTLSQKSFEASSCLSLCRWIFLTFTLTVTVQTGMLTYVDALLRCRLPFDSIGGSSLFAIGDVIFFMSKLSYFSDVISPSNVRISALPASFFDIYHSWLTYLPSKWQHTAMYVYIMILGIFGANTALRNFIWDLALTKLYSNCLLSTLNARTELKESSGPRQLSLSGNVGMDMVWNISGHDVQRSFRI